MLAFLLFLFVSAVNTQFYYPQQQQQQQQYLYNNYNPWSPYGQNSPSWNQGTQPNQASVRGNLLSDDPSPLPYGSQITVSISDVSLQDAPSRPLNTIVLYGINRFPITFEIPYSMAQVQLNGNSFQQYSIQARIEKDGQLLYINDQYTPVQLMPSPINPVNVYMKRVATSTIPGNGGIYTTRPSIINNLYMCQQYPDIGPCRASIEQYYYNAQLRSCQIFLWGGCAGNQNRFNSLEECQRTCAYYRRRSARNNAKHKWL